MSYYQYHIKYSNVLFTQNPKTPKPQNPIKSSYFFDLKLRIEIKMKRIENNVLPRRAIVKTPLCDGFSSSEESIDDDNSFELDLFQIGEAPT